MDERTVVGMNEIVGDELSTENTGKKGLKKPLIALGAVAGVVIGALGIKTLVNKTKDKRKAKKVAKASKLLETEGWIIAPPLTDDGIVD